MICQICGKEIKSNCHISKKHHISAKEYYDTYIRQQNEGYCPVCGKESSFISITRGYHIYCSKSCSATISNQKEEVIAKRIATNIERYGVDNPQKCPEVRAKTEKTSEERYGNKYHIATKEIQDKIKKIQKSKDKEYEGLTKIDILTQKYGYGWYIVRKKLGINTVMKGRYGYIANTDIPKIEEYIHSEFKHSKLECQFVDVIKQYFNGEIIRNSRRIIKPYEIDIYLPELKIAIEVNSKFYHCLEFGLDKNYHLRKSLMCREQGIRLIHIYEFENQEQQKELLKNLLLGKDKYIKEDFNKNSLISTVPQAELIYQSKRFTIYGAGKLY